MSSSKATPNAPSLSYHRYVEFERVTSKVSVTDQGVYKETQVPSAYGGAQLDLTVVHTVFMVDSRSEMLVLEFAVEEAKDKDDKIGGPVVRDGVELTPATGASTVATQQTTVRSRLLTPAQVSSGEFAKAMFLAAVKETPGQVVS